MRIPRTIVALAAALMLAACANQKAPAEKTVANIESSLAAIRADGEKYAAEQLQTVDASVKRLKGNLANKDYHAVVMGGPSVVSELNTLKVAVATKKAEIEANLAAAQTEWTSLSAEVPAMVEKLQQRVDTLAKTRKFPQGMDKAAFETAKSGFQTVKAEWTEAGSEFASGEVANAVRKARSARAHGADLMRQLEING